MAADTPAPYIDAVFRFYSDGEFDDSRVVDTVARVTGRPARQLRAVGPSPHRRVRLDGCAAPARSQGGARSPHQGAVRRAQPLLL